MSKSEKVGHHSLREAFDLFDKNMDGRISSEELMHAFKFFGKSVTSEEVKKMIIRVDTDGNGTVEFDEFCEMMKSQASSAPSEDQELWQAFKAFDHNLDNYIDFDEIKSTMHALGEQVSDEDVHAMIKEADINKDGKIDFEEFKCLMSLLHKPKKK